MIHCGPCSLLPPLGHIRDVMLVWRNGTIDKTVSASVSWCLRQNFRSCNYGTFKINYRWCLVVLASKATNLFISAMMVRFPRQWCLQFEQSKNLTRSVTCVNVLACLASQETAIERVLHWRGRQRLRMYVGLSLAQIVLHTTQLICAYSFTRIVLCLFENQNPWSIDVNLDCKNQFSGDKQHIILLWLV